MKKVVKNLSIEDYHKNDGYESSSTLKPMYDSMAHYKASKQTEKEYKSFFDFGNAFELAITDFKGEFQKKVAITDTYKWTQKALEVNPELKKVGSSKIYRELKDQFFEDNKGKLIIQDVGAESLDTILMMVSNFEKHKTARALMKNSDYQTSVYWEREGIKLKTRPDFWKKAQNGKSIVWDLKTDRSSDKDSHQKTLIKNLCPFQAVMQLDGLSENELIDINNVEYYWVVASKCQPFNVEVYRFSPEDIEQHMDHYKFKLRELKRARESGVYLSYGNPDIDAGVIDMNIPPYYKVKYGMDYRIEDGLTKINL